MGGVGRAQVYSFQNATVKVNEEQENLYVGHYRERSVPAPHPLLYKMTN